MARVNPRPILSQARLAAQVKYGPEESGLRNLATQALYDLTSGIQIQHGVAQGVMAAARALRQPMQQSYGQALGSINDAGNQLNADLQSLSPSADPYRAAAGKEQFLARARVAGAMADALKALDDRQGQAAQGEQFAVTNLQNKYGQDIGRIRQRQQDVAQEKGAYVAAEYGKQYSAEQGRQDRLESQAADRAARQQIAAAGRSQQMQLAQFRESQTNQRQARSLAAQGQRTAAKKRAAAQKGPYAPGGTFDAVYNYLYTNNAPMPGQNKATLAGLIKVARAGTGAPYNVALAATQAYVKRRYGFGGHPTAKLT